ncbi:MAG: uncharacterized protein JWR45_1936 [Blastococcus sp.]|nr:uncharacterized protein [Blastococcus sp.]
MLEVGKAGSAGVDKKSIPVLRDGVAVATLRASSWKEAATAVVGGREWVFTKAGRELSARLPAESEGAVRLRAWQKSFWSSAWSAELDGTAVEVQSVSFWKTSHRYLVDGRQVAQSGSTGGWSPRPTLTADDSVPLDHQVFLLWLELVISRRNTAAIGAATTAAVIGGST